jgi:hypothetical protein
MARIPWGLVVFGLIVALAGLAPTAIASAGTLILAQDDPNATSQADTSAQPDASPDSSTQPDATMQPTETVTPTPTVTPTVTPTATPTIPPTTLIQQTLQHSNDEQVQAIQSRDLSLMADTVTADHFQDLVTTMQDMLNHHVLSIAVLRTDWGPITVSPDGTTATATTVETWRVTSTS